MKTNFTSITKKSTRLYIGQLVGLALWLASSLSSRAQTVYVTPGGNGQQNGADWANALPGDQLQVRLANAPAGSIFRLAGGLYKPNAVGDRTSSFNIPDSVALYGGYVGSGPNPNTRINFSVPDQPSSTTLSGDIDNDNSPFDQDNSNNVVRFNRQARNQTRLDGVVITDGYATTGESVGTNPPYDFAGGGGIYNLGSPVIANCILIGNRTTGLGAGLCSYARGGTILPKLISCSFIDNDAFYGGGAIANIGYVGESSPTLINCSFTTGSTSTKGSGLYNYTASGAGTPSRANPILINCTFSRTSNAIYNLARALSLNFSMPFADVTLVNCILWDSGGSGAITNIVESGRPGARATTTLTACLLEPGVANYLDGSKANLVTNSSPFISEQNLQLRPCSPAIDAGSTVDYTGVGGSTTDLAGNARIIPAQQPIDIGAYEYQDPTNRPLAITQQPPSQSTVTAGTSVQVPVLLSGSTTSYAWYQNGGLVNGQTTATLTLTNVQPAQTGLYSLVATSACNSVTSTTFSLSVTPSEQPTNPPSVSVTAGASRLCVGSSTSLQAQVSGGTAPFTYTWSSSSGTTLGTPVTNTITVTAISAQPATVQLLVTDANNLTATASFSLTVLATPDPPSLLTQTGQFYPGEQAQVSVPQYSGNVTLLASGCANGTITWSGPNQSTGTGTIILSTNTAGAFVYRALCQQQGCSSAPVGATVVVQPAPLQVVVPLFDCATNQLTLRTTGGNGQPIEYHIPSVTQGWSSANVVSVSAKHFKKELKLTARQANPGGTGYESARLDYRLPNCGSARQGASEGESQLQVHVLGNPVQGSHVTVEIQGAEGQPVQLQMMDASGRTLSERRVEQAGSVERLTLAMGTQPDKWLLLRVSTPTQAKTIKLLKSN